MAARTRSSTTALRLLYLLLAAGVAAPAALFGFAAWQSRERIVEESELRAARAADLLEAQAATIFETHMVTLERVTDRVRGLDWGVIARSPELHEFLAATLREEPAIESVFLVSPGGMVAASSRAFPMQHYDVRDREYYTKARDGDFGLIVSAPFRGLTTGTQAFTISRARLTPTGLFDGVVAVTVSPDYFAALYSKLAEPRSSTLMMLARTDGTILVRYPSPREGVERVPSQSSLMQAVSSGVAQGVFSSAARIDGVARIISFHQLERFPVVAAFGLDEAALLRPWYHSTLEYGLAAVTVMAMLLVITGLTIRRTKAEWRVIERLREETQRRQNAEEQLRHAQKIEAVGRLTAGIAHDFNNLLTGVQGNLDLLDQSKLDEGQRRNVERAIHAAERGAKLTAQLLAFARKQHLENAPVDVAAVAGRIRDILRSTLGGKLAVETRTATGLWPVYTDATQLELALLNLAINARDAMPEGGSLVISGANRPAGTGGIPTELPHRDYVMIAVSDTGIGMSEEVKEKAFDPFFTTKPVGAGTGLGLSQVYGFARQSGGTVEIDSTLGQGTTVKIFLPRGEAEADAARVTEMPGAEASGVRRGVLLVDDDDDAREVVTAMLKDLGHTVMEAKSGTEALPLVDRGDIDLLIADYAMPGMTGVALIAEARRRRPDLPAVLITGYAEVAGSGTLAVRLGKPFRRAELEEAIARALGRAAAAGKVVPLRGGAE
jgi:signal transduction histidine kinase/ActR/RegA family two-component response regulator